MTTIIEFETDLAALIGKPTDLRPFICEGSPLDCQVFIIGYNPQTTMSADFWNFWRHGYGFEKGAWFETYKQDRRDRPLKPGKKYRPAVSNTRRVIEWILQEAGSVQCLETNIYSASSEQKSDLAFDLRVTAPIDFLINTVKPRLLVVHGEDAIKYIQGKRLDVDIINEPHFSRGYSEVKARTLGQRIRAACMPNQATLAT